MEKNSATPRTSTRISHCFYRYLMDKLANLLKFARG